MSNFVNLLDIIYPINSVYITTSTVSPATSIGGTWTQIQDGACIAAYKNTSGYTGSKHITVDQMPEHINILPQINMLVMALIMIGRTNGVVVDLTTVAYSLLNILVPREEDLIIILIHMLVESGYELLKI